jgi:dihydrofolate synthase / folylpolyglutamate synthase
VRDHDPLDWLDSLQGSGIRPGLGRMRALLRTLGQPQRAVPAIIVAGTNGKGSTSATLASILNVAGYRTGLYTSPHLIDIRERWMIAGEMIEPSLLVQCIAELRSGAERAGITPTYFEALTLLAFIAFARAGCDVAVLEVGMGGRLDATNVVRPVAAVITPIGFDHMEYLGTTIRQIAREKAGVIHRGAVVLTSNRDPVVVEILRKRAARFDSPFHVVEAGMEREWELPFAGAFQRENVALAARTAEELRTSFPLIDTQSIRRGIAATRWRGRLERVKLAGRTFWVDGCHNLHAVEAVTGYIEAQLPRPRLLVFGVMRDKNVQALTERLFPLFDTIITTEPYPPRSFEAAELAACAAAMDLPAIAAPDPADAMQVALESGARTIFVGGSLYLAGAAIAFLDQRKREEEEE